MRRCCRCCCCDDGRLFFRVLMRRMRERRVRVCGYGAGVGGRRVEAPGCVSDCDRVGVGVCVRACAPAGQGACGPARREERRRVRVRVR